jgi:hypothetical protein
MNNQIKKLTRPSLLTSSNTRSAVTPKLSCSSWSARYKPIFQKLLRVSSSQPRCITHTLARRRNKPRRRTRYYCGVVWSLGGAGRQAWMDNRRALFVFLQATIEVFEVDLLHRRMVMRFAVLVAYWCFCFWSSECMHTISIHDAFEHTCVCACRV